GRLSGHVFIFALALVSAPFALFTSDFLTAQTGFVTIQIGAFKDLHRAEAEVEKFRKLGHNAFYRYEEVQGRGKWYRIYIEKYGSTEEAKNAAIRLKDLGIITDYYIRFLEDAESHKETDKETALSGSKNPLVIKKITFQLQDEKGKEVVFIHSDGFVKPHAFSLEGERLRFVVDIQNVSSFREDRHEIEINGKYIQKIRSHLHADTGTLRIVLDLLPFKSYRIEQFFYEADNIYAIDIGLEKTGELREEIKTEKDHVQTRDVREAEEIGKDEEKGVQLRREGREITRDDVREVLLRYNFYSSCWNYNHDFCNPTGVFDNLFIDNDDGTISDHSTRLIWQKGGSSSELTVRDAVEYVKKMNRENFAGFSDWRLPTIEELASLVENVWINGDLFIEAVFDQKQKSCWSSDTHGSERAWKVNFHLGHVIDEPMVFKNSVRAVRTPKYFSNYNISSEASPQTRQRRTSRRVVIGITPLLEANGCWLPRWRDLRLDARCWTNQNNSSILIFSFFINTFITSSTGRCKK
ncbi:MAG: DUF1566 domain-containing protein, partial [Pseudomonadota bacterium]